MDFGLVLSEDSGDIPSWNSNDPSEVPGDDHSKEPSDGPSQVPHKDPHDVPNKDPGEVPGDGASNVPRERPQQGLQCPATGTLSQFGTAASTSLAQGTSASPLEATMSPCNLDDVTHVRSSR